MRSQRLRRQTTTSDETSYRHGRGCEGLRSERFFSHEGFARGIRLLVRGIFPRGLSLVFFGERRPQPRPVMLFVVPLSVPHGGREER